METNKYFLYLGVIWSLLFSGLSFYWAAGGMFGVRSLGGAIYEMALHPTPSFIAIVWITGFIKLLGVVLLIMLLMKWGNSRIQKSLYLIIKICGLLLFLYGLFNFITISLSAIGVLNLELDRYATFWRLVLWEPYWMIGGIFYFFSIKKTRECRVTRYNNI
ncbi:hypothetical protein CN326_01340 [Bacillus sp. AFS018417]|uniref:DUF3995 domain-containing protein n=1 Tax=unclassified Bacillus (in: firmicutes) TaxID=185979 RepID=UPI000BF9422C|nr:DUF3995 domain-containing protein [Bacillus sp. AFS018417]PEZ10571.1 hypothetical protein CN326_01340 [Bacillus sp. AFS018417]